MFCAVHITKKRMCRRIWTYIFSRSYKLRKVIVQELSLEEPLLQDWPMLNIDHLELNFAFYHLESLPKYLVSYTLTYFVLSCIFCFNL